jgi:DNA (cytosine-5)-methyltransferase 1
MTAYYNEIDPFAAQWLRNLIAAGHIAAGDVDERSIEDVHPDDLRNYTQCHFFAGIGVWSYALRLAGWPDDRPVWTGSCPCQPFSEAGKGSGFDDERHLWPAFHHLIKERRPPVIFGEQVASKDGLHWYDLVRSDMQGIGYAIGGGIIPAASVGAPHIRKRLFFTANADASRLSRPHEHGVALAPTEIIDAWREFERVHAASAWSSWVSASGVRPFADGIANRVGQISAYGNAIVPQAAKVFIESVMECIP